jgi:hypothetical protein
LSVAAKGKITRFYRGFCDRFLTQHLNFASLDELNDKPHHWIENHYNTQYYSGIQMITLDRFNLDREQLKFLTGDETTEEVFFMEVYARSSKPISSPSTTKDMSPGVLREKRTQVRYDRTRHD